MTMEQHYESKKLPVTSDYEKDEKKEKVVDSVVLQVHTHIKNSKIVQSPDVVATSFYCNRISTKMVFVCFYLFF